MSVGAVPIPVEDLPPPPIDAIPGGDPSAPPPVVPPAVPAMSVQELASASLSPPIPPVTPIDTTIQSGLDNLSAPVPVEPKTPVEGAKKNLEEVGKLSEEQQKNAEEKAKIDTQLAEEATKFKLNHAAALERLTQAQESHRQAAEQNVTELRAKAESTPYHTFWESRSNGEKALIGIGLILNGVSWNPQHVNRGIQMLETAEHNEMELQKAKHADLWRAVNEAQQGVKDLDQSQLRELSAFSAQEGARWDAIAGRLGAAAAANKGKGDIATIKKQALEASEKANTAWQNSIQSAAYAAHLDALDKERVLHDRAMEAARKKKGGGGGGGGSPALQAAAVKLREEIEAAQSAGKPLTGAQVDRRALELKIPPVAKAGRISVKTILDNIKESGTINKNEHTFEDKDTTRIVRDPETGKPYAKAETAKNAAQFRDKDQQLGDAARRMHELAEDIQKYGNKVVKPEDVARRVSKFANAVIAVGIVSPLGKTNETLHLETKSLGIPGATDWDHLTDTIKQFVLTQGANIENVNRKEHEIRKNRQEKRNQLTPLTAEEIAKYSSAVPGGGEGGGKWVPIPARLSGEPEAKGKKEMFVSSAGKFLGEFR